MIQFLFRASRNLGSSPDLFIDQMESAAKNNQMIDELSTTWGKSQIAGTIAVMLENRNRQKTNKMLNPDDTLGGSMIFFWSTVSS